MSKTYTYLSNFEKQVSYKIHTNTFMLTFSAVWGIKQINSEIILCWFKKINIYEKDTNVKYTYIFRKFNTWFKTPYVNNKIFLHHYNLK